MKLRILTALLLFVLSGCNKSPQEKIDDLLGAGYEHLESFEFEKAQERFNQAALLANGYPYDRLAKALILEQQLYYYDALNQYLDLAMLFPDSAFAYAGVYRLYTQFGYPDRALEAADRYYALSPQSDDAAMAKIRGLFGAGEFIKARQEIEMSAGQALDKNTAGYLKVLAFWRSNEFDSARFYLDQVSAAPSTSPAQYSIYYDALEAIGLIDSAMIISRQAAQAASAPVSVIYSHFYRALANNYYGDARQIIRLLEQKGAGQEITTALNVLIAQDQKNFTKAMILDSYYLTAAPKNVSSIMFDMAAGGTKYTDLLTILHRQSFADAYMNTFNFNSELKEFVKTQIILFKSESDDKLSTLQEFSQLKNPWASIKQVILTEVSLQHQTGQFDLAAKRLSELRAEYNNNPDWLCGIAEIYTYSGMPGVDTALKIYDEVLNNDKWFKEAFISKIRTLRDFGRYRDALNEFAKYAHFETNFRDLEMLKALCLSENNDFGTALNIFKNQGAYLKGNLEPFREFALILERKYRDKELRQLTELCAGWADDNIDILLFASRLWADQKEYSKALELSEKALALEPGLIETRVQRARALYGLGQRAVALEIFEAAAKEDASDGDIYYYYSKILAGEKIDHDRATNMARGAVRSFYSDEKAFLNLCQVYAAYGDHLDAWGDAGKGISEFPKSAPLWYQMGLASHNLGRADAEKNLKKAIEFDLGGEDLKKANEILSEY